MTNNSQIQNAERIVIKVGSSLLIDSKTGQINKPWLESFISDVQKLKLDNKEIILVTSGAVALGRRYIDVIDALDGKQAAAACGQIELIHNLKVFFESHSIIIALILLTIYDTENRRNYINARSTMLKLLKNNIIPIVNENDTVATQGIRYGDNDRLSARVAQMIDADLLIILSDIDGLYDGNPNNNKDAKLIPVVDLITPTIENMAGGAGSSVGTGGMKTKIDAAKIACSNGCKTIIASGKDFNPIAKLQNGANHTLFNTNDTPLSARKRWLYHGLIAAGTAVIDDGAKKALLNGNSLLPVGVKFIHGNFKRGDAISIKDMSGKEIGRGLANFSSDQAHSLIGLQSDDIELILGYEGRYELVHRNDMVIL